MYWLSRLQDPAPREKNEKKKHVRLFDRAQEDLWSTKSTAKCHYHPLPTYNKETQSTGSNHRPWASEQIGLAWEKAQMLHKPFAWHLDKCLSMLEKEQEWTKIQYLSPISGSVEYVKWVNLAFKPTSGTGSAHRCLMRYQPRFPFFLLAVFKPARSHLGSTSQQVQALQAEAEMLYRSQAFSASKGNSGVGVWLYIDLLYISDQILPSDKHFQRIPPPIGQLPGSAFGTTAGLSRLEAHPLDPKASANRRPHPPQKNRVASLQPSSQLDIPNS